MWQNLCECLMTNFARPSIADILRSIQENTVCTGTQCFENEESAFGIQHIGSNNSSSSSFFFVVLFIMFVLSITHAPRNLLTNKPTFTNSITNREE